MEHSIFAFFDKLNALILLLLTGLLFTLILFQGNEEVESNNCNDEIDYPTKWERDCCYQTKSIREQCVGSHDPNECIIETTPEWDVCNIK